MKKIDIYSHYLPPKFLDAYSKRVGAEYVPIDKSSQPTLLDLEARFEIMNRYEGLVQVLTPTGPGLERYVNPDDVAYLTKVYNDEMAELVHKYPDKFVAAVACLCLTNVDASLKEIDRAINELGFKGILMYTPANGRPLDSPEFMPIYEKMSNYDLPIWIHPTRLSSVPDYDSETESKYILFLILGWPYETSIAMSRLVYSGIMVKYPNLKFITHHAGGMIPFFASRLEVSTYTMELTGKPPFQDKSPIDCFRSFYNDTAIYGNPAGLQCAYEFFGAERLLFGTDMPYGPELGELYIKQTIDSVERMDISESEKEKIFEGNTRALLHLDM